MHLALVPSRPPRGLPAADFLRDAYCRGRERRLPGAPRTDPSGRFSRTRLFKSTRARIRRRASPGEQEPQNPLTKAKLLLARHFLTGLFHDPRTRYLEAF